MVPGPCSSSRAVPSSVPPPRGHLSPAPRRLPAGGRCCRKPPRRCHPAPAPRGCAAPGSAAPGTGGISRAAGVGEGIPKKTNKQQTHLAGGAEALLQLDPVGLVLHLPTEVEVGDVPQEQGGTGDGQHAAAHGRHLGAQRAWHGTARHKMAWKNMAPCPQTPPLPPRWPACAGGRCSECRGGRRRWQRAS